MNNELLHHLEQRINAAVEEISTLRQRISELEMQNYELSEERDETKAQLAQQAEQTTNWESSLNQMLSKLNEKICYSGTSCRGHQRICRWTIFSSIQL